MRLTVFILLSYFTYAQTITGKVVEENTGTAIPYATVGLIKQNTGTTANENGEFKIFSRLSIDTLIISSVGHRSIRRPTNQLGTDPVFTLSIEEKQLKTVIVKDRQTSADVGGYKKYQEYCYTSSGYQSQVARKLTAPESNSILRSVHIRMSKYSPGTAMFRLRIYDVDSITRGPGEELTDPSFRSIRKSCSSR